MKAPLEGIRVLEVANWLVAPCTAALMVDMGAEAIKVEPPGGDALRTFDMKTLGYDYDFAGNYVFELDNRGKRSITIDLEKPGGPELVQRLAQDVDVFVTNLIQSRRERYRLTPEQIHAINPTAVYASFSGYGTRGPDAARPGFDYAAFWARSGVMHSLTLPNSPPPLCRPGQGDHTTTLNLLAGVLAALRLRDATGEGQLVDTTLMGTGMWTIGTDLASVLIAKQQPPPHDHAAPGNPLHNAYECSDGRWVQLVMPQPDRFWAAVCEMLELQEWATDTRYDSITKRREQTRDLTLGIAERFLQHDFVYWEKQLDAFGLIWAPVSTLPDLIDDPQVREMEIFAEIDHPELGRFETMNTPFQIAGADISVRGPAPGPGQHTVEILQEAGLDDDEVATLAADGVFG
jgi:crotonobetainyl-CoA:carnitine CoA-transferase CaiB-like acyl-CoA transferase